MKICVAHGGLGHGGSEAIPIVLLDALQGEHELTLVTGRPVQWDRLNDAFHTAVDPQRVAVSLAPMPAWLLRGGPGDALRGAYFARHVRRLPAKFDLCIGGYNVVPFSQPAIQFVADMSWDDDYRRNNDPALPGLRGLMQSGSPMRALYLGLTGAIAGRSDPSVRANDLIIANSQWTARLLKERHNLDSRVIYPPVHKEPFDGNEPRSGDFVMLGRVTPDKRIDEAIRILARVRARGHAFRFHIIGPLDNSVYAVSLKKLTCEHGDWVKLRGGMFGKEKFSELARHSFSLHMHTREAFGIAVAEQAAMGLIPFVPANSAPLEIVGDKRLCFDNADDAIATIDRVLCDPGEQRELRSSLEARSAQFSRQRFLHDFNALLHSAQFPKRTVPK